MTSSVAKTCFDAIRAKQSAVTAGYDPMVVENQSIYKQLLLRAVDSASIEEESGTDSTPKAKTRTRRQTPLVNAGYASRVLSISYAIRSFVSYHRLVCSSLAQKQLPTTMNTKRRIRIVILGCGVDVIGLWARSLVHSDDDAMAITIIEVDKPEICSVKRIMIDDQGMVDNLVERSTDQLTTKSKDASKYYTGNIILPSSSSSTSPNENRESSTGNSQGDGYDYVLIPGDLNDTSTLEPILLLDEINEQERVPTLIVSELVLSYLTPSGTDSLLRWCSDRLCTASDSVLLLLEPLGSSHMPNETSTTRANVSVHGVVSVEEGYQHDYSQSFHHKMERGRCPNRIETPKFQSPKDSFYPIGSSHETISCRLEENGFSGDSSVTSLGVISSVAAASVPKRNNNNNNNNRRTVICPEIFDEHAALILHLQTYVLVCGFVAPQTQQPADLLFRRLLCPWECRLNTGPNLALMRSGLPIMDTEEGIVYNEIEVCDEASVRSLFQSTYDKECTDEYPAIRKMVKAALNSDLRETAKPSMTTLSQGVMDDRKRSQPGANSSFSAIGNFYRSLGGIFLVAAKYTMLPVKEDEMMCRNGDHLIQSKVRQVVGCVGIRSHKVSDANSSTTLEIFRLAVAIKYRGRGIGRNLLSAAERYAKERWNKQPHEKLKFVASTLTILEGATILYEKCGYRVESETTLGNNLVLSTYTKEADVGHQF
jgi:ribosomal protein S18 acetylase RimI-like enzyme